MAINSKNIQLQFQGYVNTPLLWKDKTVLGLKQLGLPELSTLVFNEILPDNLRLGKRVERFVSAELQEISHIKVLLENAQIQNQKTTVGEIDCILMFDEQPIHLEIIYKFYLFDSSVGTTEIDHWIGPNRNDTLVKKLNKLKDKQLPLLKNRHTQPILDTLNLHAENILQRVHFKAQLFTPYNASAVAFTLLNKDCLTGFYVYFSEIRKFETCKFNIPMKIDWLLEVQTNVNWLGYDPFYEKLEHLIHKEIAPLCWIKFPNGSIQKFFVVWWT